MMNPVSTGKVIGQLMLPLNAGTIAKISGVEEIKNDPAVINYIQYYHEGDTIPESAIGTLGQHFGRIFIEADCKENLVAIVNRLQDGVSVQSEDGTELYTMRFDTGRLGK